MSARFCVCGAVVVGKCHRCTRPVWRPPAAERGYDTAWHRLSKSFRMENPLCQVCLERGRTTPARDVHHRIPIRVRPDLRLERDNLMSVCRTCHSEIEGKEPLGGYH